MSRVRSCRTVFPTSGVWQDISAADVADAEVAGGDVPTAHVPAAHLPAADVPAAHVPTAHLPAADVPAAAHLPAADVHAAAVTAADVPAAGVSAVDVAPEQVTGDMHTAADRVTYSQPDSTFDEASMMTVFHVAAQRAQTDPESIVWLSLRSSKLVTLDVDSETGNVNAVMRICDASTQSSMPHEINVDASLLEYMLGLPLLQAATMLNARDDDQQWVTTRLVTLRSNCRNVPSVGIRCHRKAGDDRSLVVAALRRPSREGGVGRGGGVVLVGAVARGSTGV